MARTDAGLTISELAKRAGVSRDTVSNAERGQHSLQAPTLNKLARALGRTPSDLLAEEERLTPKARRRSSLEPSLLNGLEEERREATNDSWLEFVNGFVDRWEEKARVGNFDLGGLKEFEDVVDGLLETLPPWDEYGDDPQINAAVWRLFDLLPEVSTAAEAKFSAAEIKPIREKQAAQTAALENITRRSA